MKRWSAMMAGRSGWLRRRSVDRSWGDGCEQDFAECESRSHCGRVEETMRNAEQRQSDTGGVVVERFRAGEVERGDLRRKRLGWSGDFVSSGVALLSPA